MPELIRFEADGPLIRLTLTDPKRFNALSFEMLAALNEALDKIEANADARVVILAGEGKAFCAGHDLRQMQAARTAADGGRAEYERLFTQCGALMMRLSALPQPVIAQVHGIATAAGCQLVASCDLAVAAQGTRFGVNGVNIGLFCATPMVALKRAVPNKIALEMLLTGEFIEADRAREIGLVNRVVAPDDLAAQTERLAQTIASKLPAAVRLGKAAFHHDNALARAYEAASAVMCENLMLPDTDEGISAFLEKRSPRWS